MTRQASPPSAAARWWAQRPPREQHLLRAATALIAVALLWTVGLAPAWRTLQAYPARHAALDAQLRTMQGLQARAQALQGQAAIDPRAAQAALQSGVAGLGRRATVLVTGRQAVVTLQAVDATTLATWLAQTRQDARLLPTQASLTRAGDRWSGTVQFTLPGG